jgi:ketosteroid isomerase-like protein
MISGQAIVSAFWTAADGRDWATFAELLADDVVYEAPQSHERVTGKEAYLRFNIEGFPTDWHVTIVRVVADELGGAASWIEITDEDGTHPGLSFFEIRDERIVTITDFWPQEYEPLAGRARLTERFSL